VRLARLETALGDRVDELGRGVVEEDRSGFSAERRHERRTVVEQQRRPEARPETSQFHIIQPQVVK
jgi:hypothetical protein